MRQVVLVSGHICTGKSGLARRLREKFDFHLLRTSEFLATEAEKRKRATDRLSLQELGSILDGETDFAWIALQVTAALLKTSKPIVVDNVRTYGQLKQLRKLKDVQVVHTPILDETQISELPPASIRATVRWDKNPWAAIQGDPKQVREPVFWLWPYWMARYLEIIKSDN